MEASSIWFNTQFTLGRLPHILRLKSLDPDIFGPAFKVEIENTDYLVKTADHPDELLQVLRLRFEVFFREFSGKKVTFSLFPYDIDMHDFLCDHLIVKDKLSDQVVACYRLLSTNSGKQIKKFYSQGEFVFDDLLKTSGHKLELGRACVHKDYRKGAVISLLWRGLISYAKQSQTRYMFGCSSINRADFPYLSQIIESIEKQGGFIDEYSIGVRPDYTLNIHPEQAKDRNPKAMNSLMHMYLLAGARFGRVMAYDAEMDCIDLFTLMDMEKLPASFERRFS
jgi:putative hemolysin